MASGHKRWSVIAKKPVATGPGLRSDHASRLGFALYARHGVGSILISRSLARAFLVSVALLRPALLLAGCDTDQVSLATNAKANQPVPPKLLAAMVEKDMDLQSPILVRLFKQEAELEVWKQTRNGQFALLKTYPICRWSGDLGPKVREGDRQAPEGFYSINPGQMNPQSAYYLSFNTGYPNAFDKALGRTGSQLMVHGDCSSRGCYAMTDEQIAEIYSLGRESFFGGQKAFQLQAYPFKMTPVNMAKHRNNPNMPFWKMIKEGYDHFEVTRQEPKVDFCEQKYVFDATKPPDAKRDPVFDASAKCPAYVIPENIASAVRDKDARDQAEYRQAGRQGHADRAHEHRHRRRHEQDFCREDSGGIDRTVGGRRRLDPGDAGDGEGAGHDPRTRQSAQAQSRCGSRRSPQDRSRSSPSARPPPTPASPRPRRPARNPKRNRQAASSPTSAARWASAPPTRRRPRLRRKRPRPWPRPLRPQRHPPRRRG